MTQPFTTDLHPDGVAEVVINQPPVNALNAAGWHALAQNIHTLGQQPEVRVIVIRAEGRGFCAGVDIKELNENPDLIVSVNAGNYATFKAVHLNPVPVIAAVHGVAFGGGFQLALGADIRFVTPDARMSVMEIKWGLVPDMAGVLLMRGLARDDVIRELTFSGRIFDGVEAQSLGFATRVCADPREQALALAHEIAGRNPDAIRAGKRLLNLPAATSALAVLQAESDEQIKLLGSPNQVEAVAAALQKRAPNFRDSV